MDGDRTSLEANWLGACRQATDGLRTMLAQTPGRAERVAETGTLGSGGDRTLVIDAAAEEIVFEQLSRLHAEGARFTAVSEERGEVDFGAGAVRVVVDPIDGSLNAKRGLSHYALSIAVASGPTVGDVEFGYVYDFGPSEEWWARRGEGSWLNGVRLDPGVKERRDPTGKIEIVGIEAAEPELIAASIDALVGRAYRVRALGTIAVALCQVAAGRFDAAVTLRPCRAVDAAAGALIVLEAGGRVSFTRAAAPPLGFGLDLSARSPVVAARSPSTLQELERVAP